MDSKTYGWAGSVAEYLKTSENNFIESLSIHQNVSLNENPSSSQLSAWINCHRILSKLFRELADVDSEMENLCIIFEYELPRERGRRPDVLLLNNSQVIVLEFKDFSTSTPAFIDQVSSYARDLKHYHAGSHNLEVIPVLILTRARNLFEQVGNVLITGEDSLKNNLVNLVRLSKTNTIDLKSWINSDYEPLPSLVSAARRIFKHEPLPYIRRAQSAGIPQTISILVNIAKEAQLKSERHLALVTGAPGAGKTLVGLQLVYSNYFDDQGSERSAVFLSGNGPLVQVLQHALKSRIFVQDVHGFLRQYGGRSSKLPNEHIWIYDEAQRAWDSQRVGEKRGHAVSEPEDFLWIGEKKANWSVMIGLIGEGQEIHLGEEAGLTQWNDAISTMPNRWIVNCPDRIKTLFSKADDVRSHKELDLNISLRTHIAEDVQDWVKSLLEGNLSRAKVMSKKVHDQGFNMYITKHLDNAKQYVFVRYQGEIDKRYGLIASSKAKNLPNYGVYNDYQSTRRVKYGSWYNDEPNSQLSCCQLKDVVTEFGCQGLELDFPVVCWGGDLHWDGSKWKSPGQPRSKAKDPHALRVNSYRVLLTRGRDGFIIFIPDVPAAEQTYEALVAAGVKIL